MNVVDRRAALERWDTEIVAAYTAQSSPNPPVLEPCEITLQRIRVRDLLLVVGDLAARSADAFGESLATLDNAALRDAVLGVAIDRYVSAVPRPGRNGSSSMADHIVSGLIHRSDARRRAALTSLEVALPATSRTKLDAEVRRALDETELGDFSWDGDLSADLRSSVIEAVLAEWMRQRADAYGAAPALKLAHRGTEIRTRRHRRCERER